MNLALPESASQSEIRQKAREWASNYVVNAYLVKVLLTYDAVRSADLFDVHGWSHVEKALSGGKGVVLVSSHVSCERLVRWFLRTQDLEPLYILKLNKPRASDMSSDAVRRRSKRKRKGLDDDDVVGDEDFRFDYMRLAYARLRSNGIVNLFATGRFGDRWVPVTICRGQLPVRVGAAVLGELTGAPLLPCFATMTPDGRFQIEFQEQLASPESSNRGERYRLLMEAYGSRLEDYILRHPTNVFKPRLQDLLDPGPPQHDPAVGVDQFNVECIATTTFPRRR